MKRLNGHYIFEAKDLPTRALYERADLREALKGGMEFCCKCLMVGDDLERHMCKGGSLTMGLKKPRKQGA